MISMFNFLALISNFGNFGDFELRIIITTVKMKISCEIIKNDILSGTTVHILDV